MKLRFAKYILSGRNQLEQIQNTFLGFQLVSYVSCYLQFRFKLKIFHVKASVFF